MPLMSFGLPPSPIGGRPPPPNAEKPPCTLSGVGSENSPIEPIPMFVWSEFERLPGRPCPWCIEGSDVPSDEPGWNQPEVWCTPSGERALLFCDEDDGGMISGWVMCPRCNGGGDTLEMLPRFGRVRRAGPPFVLGGGCGSDRMEERLRERERPCEEVGGPLEDGDGVCLVRKSPGFVAFVVVVFDEKLDRPDRCELKELTLEGSPLFPPLPLFDPLPFEDVLSAKGCDCAFWE